MWHFLAETTQQDATQGRMGGRQSVYQATDGTRIISPARPQPEPTRAPNRKRHADATPAKPLAAYPTPCPPNPQLHVHQTSNATPTRPFAFSRKNSRIFPCRGQDARTAARPKRIPPPEKEPAMVEQTFECSNCYEVFNKEHTTEVLWTQCPHCGGRAYPY